MLFRSSGCRCPPAACPRMLSALPVRSCTVRLLSMRQPVPPVLRCSFYSPRLSLIRSGSLPSVYHAFSPQKSLCTQNGLLQASKHAQKSVRLLKYSHPPTFFVRRLFSSFFLLLLVHHLDLALFPQHIGGQDAGKGGICQMSMTKVQTAFWGYFGHGILQRTFTALK